MHTPDELQRKFWDSLGADRTVMLGLEEERPRLRPMTAQVEDGQAPIWFFTTKDNELVQGLGERNRGLVSYASKGHDLFAVVHGILTLDTDRYTIDRLWSPFVAAWYEGGKGDPKLALLRFEPDDAQIWLSESGLLAGVRLLLGGDPKKDLAGNVAKVRLS